MSKINVADLNKEELDAAYEYFDKMCKKYLKFLKNVDARWVWIAKSMAKKKGFFTRLFDNSERFGCIEGYYKFKKKTENYIKHRDAIKNVINAFTISKNITLEQDEINALVKFNSIKINLLK